MTRRHRADQPGSWHHVVNRGIAKRAFFESRDDARFFLARAAVTGFTGPNYWLHDTRSSSTATVRKSRERARAAGQLRPGSAS